MTDYNTKQVSDKLVKEMVEAVSNVRGWGSVEIYIQDYKVVQITERNIKKTNNMDDRQLDRHNGKIGS